MDKDTHFLTETLRLAKKGLGWTNPNPMVGAIIVKNGQVIGKGFHRKAGLAHAEIEALNTVTQDPKDATLYVTMAPCNHFGKTPPCTESIIKSGIKEIVCCSLDPNPKVHGQGLNRLKKAGIKVSAGILENEARQLNKAFFTFHEKKRPFVAIKFAASLDGKMATRTGDSKWITNENARSFARNLRGQYQAVLVGINTVLTDNPNLGTSGKGRRNPTRIILDPKLRIPFDADVLRDTNCIIVTTTKAHKPKIKLMKTQGFTVLVFNSEYIPIKKLLSKLREKEIISILVEGGNKTLENFIDAGIIDKVYAFHAPMLIGKRPTINESLYLENTSFKKFNDNLLTISNNC